jgi:hypothetical protein
MKPILVVLYLASLLGGLGLAKTGAVKKVADREVFVPAHDLAVSCQAVKGAVGEDYLLNSGKTYKVTTVDMVAIGRCAGYIEGVADEFREAIGCYHPITAGRGELPILADTFLKRVAEHPEEADFAASTVLQEVDNDVLRLCGDCGFGLLVRSGGRK